MLLKLTGEHLRFCPRDYTCCTSVMEETLVRQSEADFLTSVEETSQFLLTSFTHTHRRFDGKLFLLRFLTVHCHQVHLPSTYTFTQHYRTVHAWTTYWSPSGLICQSTPLCFIPSYHQRITFLTPCINCPLRIIQKVKPVSVLRLEF